MAAQLIRRLSDYRLFPNSQDQTTGPEATAPQQAPAHRAPDTPLLLKENTPAPQAAAPAEPAPVPPEFQTQRTLSRPAAAEPVQAQRPAAPAEPPPAPYTAAPAEPPAAPPKASPAPAPTAASSNRRLWREELARLEASANQAMEALMPGAPSAADHVDTAQARPEPAPSRHDQTPTEPDAFAADPAAYDGRSPAIRQGMDINRRAIEQAAESQNRTRPAANGHDYLAMEEMAIDRLLETTNALLKTDDHARKNQSLDRQKAAVVATEAERRARSKNRAGSVTLNFDEDGGDTHPVANVLTTPYIDPEKRAKRLRDYRKMISEHKKRT